MPAIPGAPAPRHRMDLFEVGYTPGLELLMDNAGTIPHRDIRTRLPANVVTEMLWSR